MDRAYDSFRAAAEAYAASAASGASQIGWALWNASRILSERGEHKAARRLLDEIEDNWRDSIAEDARVRGPFYSSVTENRLALGDLAEAERYADRAHSLLVRLDGESVDVAIALALTAKVANARNDVPRALARYREALAMIERVAPERSALRGAWQHLPQPRACRANNGPQTCRNRPPWRRACGRGWRRRMRTLWPASHWSTTPGCCPPSHRWGSWRRLTWPARCGWTWKHRCS